MFQIETALLKFDGMDESEDGKSSVVKRCVVNPLFANPTEKPTHPTLSYFQFVLWDPAPAVDCADARRCPEGLNARFGKRLFYTSSYRV